MDSIKVPCDGGTTYVIPCWPADVAPHLNGYEFVVHKVIEPFNSWVVSEKETGMRVPHAVGDDMDEATERAKKVLAGITPEKMATTMARAGKILSELGFI